MSISFEKMSTHRRPKTCSLLLVTLSLFQTFTDVATLSETEKLHALLNSDQYDSSIRPEAIHGKPNVVGLALLITKLSSFKETEMEFEASFHFGQKWKDFRLADPSRTHSVSLCYSMFPKLWVPDTFFSNEKSAFLHTISVPNRMIVVAPDGTINYAQKLTAKLGCEFHLRKFPHDSQICKITMESYGYMTDDIILDWYLKMDPTETRTMFKIPEFTMTGHNYSDCTAVYPVGSFSCLELEIHLSRDLSYYVTRVFLPSFLIVGLSWLAFWIDYKSVAARTSLGLLTVLSIITQSTSLSTRLPAVSYLKAYDLWMAVCLVFVFGALVEFLLVTVVMRVGKGKQELPRQSLHTPSMASKQTEEKAQDISVFSMETIDKTESAQGRSKQILSAMSRMVQVKPSTAMQVDRFARYLFPGSFVVFNICYWTVYNIIDDV